ncbi:kinesin-like protein KIFC1 isoform X1 [Anas acuta]|uniref:kinesin-like protein KIFC1 isoform X1 n=1 Tax=Anas acuta TaxID=28680 RepID=UPI0035C8B318
MAARPGGDGAGAARPGPGVWRRWVVRYQRYQRRRLEELQQKIRGLEDDNRQLREQLQHSQARVEELEGQVSFLRKQLQQCQEERSRWQQLEAELQQWHQELQELWESARYREEQLGAAQAKLQEVSEALSQSEAEDSELRALVAAQEKHLHNLEMEQRRLENRLQDLQVLIPPAPRKKINSVLTETRTGVQVNKCSVLGPSLQEGHRGA